jgi:hypothetical protein
MTSFIKLALYDMVHNKLGVNKTNFRKALVYRYDFPQNLHFLRQVLRISDKT